MVNPYAYKNFEVTEEPAEDPDPSAAASIAGFNFKIHLANSATTFYWITGYIQIIPLLLYHLTASRNFSFCFFRCSVRCFISHIGFIRLMNLTKRIVAIIAFSIGLIFSVISIGSVAFAQQQGNNFVVLTIDYRSVNCR